MDNGTITLLKKDGVIAAFAIDQQEGLPTIVSHRKYTGKTNYSIQSFDEFDYAVDVLKENINGSQRRKWTIIYQAARSWG